MLIIKPKWIILTNHRIIITVGPMATMLATIPTLVLTLLLITVVKLHIKTTWEVPSATRIGATLADYYLGCIYLYTVIAMILQTTVA